MEGDYRIRRADICDLDVLISFTKLEARETEGSEPDPDSLAVGVRSGLEGTAPASYWVAQSKDGGIVGSISVVTEWSNFRGGHYWWIQSLFVVPEHRGSGLVDLLLNSVAEAARAAQALDLRLYVLKSNERAVSAYRRCHFDVAPYSIMVRRLEPE